MWPDGGGIQCESGEKVDNFQLSAVEKTLSVLKLSCSVLYEL